MPGDEMEELLADLNQAIEDLARLRADYELNVEVIQKMTEQLEGGESDE